LKLFKIKNNFFEKYGPTGLSNNITVSQTINSKYNYEFQPSQTYQLENSPIYFSSEVKHKKINLELIQLTRRINP
jgi:hypothetical protein